MYTPNSKIKFDGAGTKRADYFTLKVGTKKMGKSDGFSIKYNFTLNEAELFADQLKTTNPYSTITIVGHIDTKKRRKELSSKPWDGKDYSIELGTYHNPTTDKDEIINVQLYSKARNTIVKSVSPFDVGLLFQYPLNKRQMDYLDGVEKRVRASRG